MGREHFMGMELQSWEMEISGDDGGGGWDAAQHVSVLKALSCALRKG